MNFPEKYNKIWGKCLPLLEMCRPGDTEHARKLAEFVLNYTGMEIDKDVLVPAAMMHDIGHSAILPEHFVYISGLKKISNSKLVHMLAGAKIAKDILDSIGYDKQKIEEIVDVISIHDGDQLSGVNVKDIFNTENKKIFHDIDSLDRYNEERLKEFVSSPEERGKMLNILENFLGMFFYDEFRSVAKANFDKLKQDS